MRTLRRGTVRFGFAHHASRSLRPAPTQVKHLCLGAVGLTAVHRKRKRKQNCGNRVAFSQQQNGCPRTGKRRCKRRNRTHQRTTLPKMLSENRKTALQTTRQVLPLRVILPKTVSVRCSVRSAEIGDQLGENRNLPPEQAIFGQARTERQTASISS